MAEEFAAYVHEIGKSEEDISQHDSDGEDDANRAAFRAYISDVHRRKGKVGTPQKKRATGASSGSHLGSDGSQWHRCCEHFHPARPPYRGPTGDGEFY